MKNPRIAIAPVEDEKQPIEKGKPRVRGYQLEVVDRDDPSKRCTGTQLAGVVFNHLYTKHDEPVVVRQIALAKVTPEVVEKGACPLEEYRLVYRIASVHRPDDSVCTHDLNNSWARRAWRRLFGFDLPALPPPEISSKMSELPLVFPDQMANYVVVIPDADYDSNGAPQKSDSTGLPKVPDDAPEWYELACGGGALAHTELNGLVELGDPKEVRTAALRMLRANYRGNRTETLDGIPIGFQRNRPRAQQYTERCAKPPPEVSADTSATGTSVIDTSAIKEEDVEARWTETGALCASRSRLWMKDGVVTAARRYPGMTLKASERAFLNEIKKRPPVTPEKGGPPLIPEFEVPCDPANKNAPIVWFTSGVVHHINDHRKQDEQPPSGLSGLPAQ